MTALAVLPRGGLGDVLYHALFAKYVAHQFPEFEPVLLAPAYAKFLTSLLGVKHVPVETFFSDASLGLHARNEWTFLKALRSAAGGCLASFTNDLLDHVIAKVMRMEIFDMGILGNAAVALDTAPGRFSRYRLNRTFGYLHMGAVNPKHLVDRQQHALAQRRHSAHLTASYRSLWLAALSPHIRPGAPEKTVLIFPETARTKKNLRFDQVESIVSRLQGRYRIRIFTPDPNRYASLGEVVGFEDKFAPLREIARAAAVFTADTFAAHLSGLWGTPTYTIYNFAYRQRWCEYWGSPFANALHFESGRAYRLQKDFTAIPAWQESSLFDAALQASANPAEACQQEPALTGYAVR